MTDTDRIERDEDRKRWLAVEVPGFKKIIVDDDFKGVIQMYEVKLYYSGYVVHIVKAESSEEAILKARKGQDRAYWNEEEYFDAHREVINTLIPWPEADTAEEVI